MNVPWMISPDGPLSAPFQGQKGTPKAFGAPRRFQDHELALQGAEGFCQNIAAHLTTWKTALS